MFKSRIETVYNWWRDEKEFYNIEFSQGADYVKVSKYSMSQIASIDQVAYVHLPLLITHRGWHPTPGWDLSSLHPICIFMIKSFAIQVRIDGFSMLDNNDREGDNEGSEDSDTDDVRTLVTTRPQEE